MPPSSNLALYQAYFDLWQRALESPKGIAIDCPTPEEARNLRFTLLRARSAQAKAHKKIYPPGHDRWGKSFYDDLTTKISPTKPTVVQIIHPGDMLPYEVTEL